MAKTQSQSMTVRCPFDGGHETDVPWQETDHLVGMGWAVYMYCPDCQINHYHLVESR